MFKLTKLLCAAGSMALCVTATSLSASSAEKYVGYYYPEVTSHELFDRVIQESPPAIHDIRVEFATMLSLSQHDAPYPPSYAAYAKGSEADTLIITGLNDDVFKTLYRARAIMARTSSTLRASDFFLSQGLQYDATFYDMLQILEFRRLILTDGETWAHEVRFERPF